MFAANTAAEPLDDPPGTYSLFQGFGRTKIRIFTRSTMCHASQFNLPIEIAPADSSLLTEVAEYAGI